MVNIYASFRRCATIAVASKTCNGTVAVCDKAQQNYGKSVKWEIFSQFWNVTHERWEYFFPSPDFKYSVIMYLHIRSDLDSITMFILSGPRRQPKSGWAPPVQWPVMIGSQCLKLATSYSIAPKHNIGTMNFSNSLPKLVYICRFCVLHYIEFID